MCHHWGFTSIYLTLSYPYRSFIYQLIHLNFYVPLSIYLSIYQFIYPSINISIYLFIHLSIHPTIYLPIYLGSVRNDGLEDRELDKYSSINETVAMVKSFQIERQLNHSRQYLPFNSGILLSSK